MSQIVRKYIPLALTSVLGFFIMFSFPINNKAFSDVSNLFGSWVNLLAAFALMLGAYNVVMIHGKNVISKKKNQWLFSIPLLLTLIFVTLLGLIFNVTSSSYKYVYDILIGSGILTLTSLRGFFTFSAFYRAFKARTFESFIMVFGCVLTLFYVEPIAETFLPQLNIFTGWLMNVPYVGGTRTIELVSGIALFIMSIRLIFGIDKSWMAGET